MGKQSIMHVGAHSVVHPDTRSLTRPVAVAGLMCIGLVWIALDARAGADGAAAVVDEARSLAETQLVIPAGPPIQLDGRCTEYGAGNAAVVTLSSVAGSEVFLRTSGGALITCFKDLPLTDNGQSQLPFAALYIDGDNSGGAMPARDDYRVRITLDESDPLLERGDGAGGWLTETDTGWEAASVGHICQRVLCADAEIRMPANLIAGWDARWGMLLAHHWLTAPGDDRIWPWTPAAGLPLVPNTWADVHREGVRPPTATASPTAGTGPTDTPTASPTVTSGATPTTTSTATPTSTGPTPTPTTTPIPTVLPPVEAGLALIPATSYSGGTVTALGANYDCRSPGIELRWEDGRLMGQVAAEPLELRLPIPPGVTPGLYQIVAGCADGSGRSAAADVTILDPPPAPRAAMLVPGGPVFVAQPLALLDRSSGAVVRRDWDFGDGSPLAHHTDGVHRWLSAGTFTVTLTVYDPIGRTDVRQHALEVRGAVAVGRLSVQPDGRTVAFLDQSVGPFTVRRWEFDDGQENDQVSGSHRYAEPGTYMPRLVVSYPGAGGIPEVHVAELGPVVIGSGEADNLAVVGLAMVQANLGDWRLAAGRRTVARVAVQRSGALAADGPVPSIVRIRATRLDGSSLAGTPVLRDRRRIDDAPVGVLREAYEFELPAAWSRPQLQLVIDPILGRLEIARPIVVTAGVLMSDGGETTEADNRLSREFLFRPAEPVDLLAVPLRPPAGLEIENGDLLAYYHRLSRALPVADGDVRLWLPPGGGAVPVLADRTSGVGAALEAARQALRVQDAGPHLRAVALTADGAAAASADCVAASAAAGRGLWIAERTAEGHEGQQRTAIALIQAIAGSFGLGFTPDATPDRGLVDLDYPEPGGRLDHDGFDVDALRLLPRHETRDYMSPAACADGHAWWSAYHGARLADRLVEAAGSGDGGVVTGSDADRVVAGRGAGWVVAGSDSDPVVARGDSGLLVAGSDSGQVVTGSNTGQVVTGSDNDRAAEGKTGIRQSTYRLSAVSHQSEDPLPAASDYAVFSGIVRPPDTAGPRVTVDPIFHQPERTSSRDDAPGSGNWAIVQEDETAVVLFTRFMKLVFYRGPDGTLEPDAFLEVVPWSPYTRRVLIRQREEILWSRDVPADWPRVTILRPAAGEGWAQGRSYRVVWRAEDPAGLALTYQIDISPDDGGQWRPVGTVMGDTDVTLDAAHLPGCGACRLRVRVSNGVLMDEALSGAFSIEPPAPVVEILAPNDGAVFPAGEPIWLMGVAYDYTDGPLGAGRVSWSSNLDGGLGLDPTVQTVLSAGRHVVRFNAINSHGLAASATIMLRVASTRRPYEVFAPYAQQAPAEP